MLMVAERDAAEIMARAEEEATRMADATREALAEARYVRGTADREAASLLAEAQDRAAQTMAAAWRELEAAIELSEAEQRSGTPGG
jgi:hypothetical protein